MAYPKTSGQEIRELQSENAQLRALLKDYHSAALIGASIEDPAESDIVDYTQRMLDLIQRAEDLMPELIEEASDELFLESDETLA